MRILHVITMLDIGGAERLMVDLLPLLRDIGHHRVELLLFNGVETAFRSELESKNIRIHELSHGHDVKKYHWNVYNPWNIIKLRKFLRGYDIIHTHNTACQLYVPIANCLFRRREKLVTTEHNTTNRRRSIWWYKPIDRWMYRQYKKVICISDETNKHLESYIGMQSQICVINNGVNIKRFLRPVAELSFDKRCFMITMVAAFRDQKDHETLLRAMTYLPEKYSLRLVGDGENKNRIEQLCFEMSISNRVDFMGNRSDVSVILEESDVVVLSSHWEGFGLAAVEAMASGRPLVASDVDGLREVVKGAGILFPHGDDKALARSIRDLCENPDNYYKVAKACQVRAKDFDISKMAQGYLDLYESLV